MTGSVHPDFVLHFPELLREAVLANAMHYGEMLDVDLTVFDKN